MQVSSTQHPVLDIYRSFEIAADTTVVNSEQSHDRIVEIYNKARVCRDDVEKERKRAIKPFNDYVTMINARALLATTILDRAMIAATIKSCRYQHIPDLSPSTSPDAQETKEEVVLGVVPRIEAKKLAFMVDLSKVPHKYIKIDVEKVRNDLNAGIEIPGIQEIK